VTPFDGLFDIRILEDNIGALASEFKSNLLQPRGLNDLLSNSSGASERNLIDTRMTHNGCSGGLSKPRKDVDRSGRESSLLNERTKVQSAQRCLFRSLEDDGITASKCRCNFPG